jgi:hypothetical protein
MKAQLFMLSAAGFVLAASAAQAAPEPAIQSFLRDIAVRAEARLAQADGSLPGHPVRVRVVVSGSRLTVVRVETPDGACASDPNVQRSLRRLAVDDEPALLTGRELTLTLRAR